MSFSLALTPAFVGEVKAANGADDLVDALKPVVGTEVDEATGGYRRVADTWKSSARPASTTWALCLRTLGPYAVLQPRL